MHTRAVLEICRSCCALWTRTVNDKSTFNWPG